MNKKILIAEIVLSLIASVAVLFYVTDPFGEYRTYWYRAEEERIIEYDWDCTVGSSTGEYAIFLNTYDNLYHVCQQYTSAAFTGNSIQSR